MSYPKDPSYGKPGEWSSPYPAQMGQPAGMYPPSAYPSAPPPYSALPPSTMPGGAPPPQYPPSQYPYGPGMPQPYPPGPAHYAPGPQPGYNPGYPVQPNFNYAMPPGPAVAQFDSGARFDGIATPNIPPPPPGYAPTAAQMAVAQGQPVVGSQKKASWFSGGSGGGVSFW